MTQIIINVSEKRPSRISCFRKSFIEELFEKFSIESDFWNKTYLDLYLYDKTKFFDVLKDHKLTNLEDNINTEIINNWRTNTDLINYIEQRNKKYINDYKKLFGDIDGELDEFKIITLDKDDDQEDYNIEYFHNNREYIRAKINYKEMLKDLKNMIIDQIKLHDIAMYYRLNGSNKYTKNFMKDVIDCGDGECFGCDEYEHKCQKYSYEDDYDFEGDTYY